MPLTNAQKQARHRAKKEKHIQQLKQRIEKMMLKIFTVYDNKAEAYLPPLFFKSTGEAIRAFSDTANDPSTTIGKHYADYQLFELGTYDDATATFDFKSSPVNLGNGVEFHLGATLGQVIEKETEAVPLFPDPVTSQERK